MTQADTNKDGYVDKDEFLKLMDNTNRALTNRQQSVFKQYLTVMANAEVYRWWPPPCLMVLTSLLQIGLFIHQNLSSKETLVNCSVLVYDPHLRSQVWRFVTYMLVHVSTEHLCFNILMQFIVGVPLEMSHGCARVATVYFLGVLSGSLANSVVETEVYLAGASGGVYALVTAHLATLILNWHEDTVIIRHRFRRNRKTTSANMPGLSLRILRLLVVLVYTCVDFSMAFYKRSVSKVSVTAHLCGALSGILVGLVVLKNRKVECWEKHLKVASLVAYAIFLLTFFLWNILADSIHSLMYNQPYFLPHKYYCQEEDKVEPGLTSVAPRLP